MDSRLINYGAVVVRSFKEVFASWRYTAFAVSIFLVTIYLELWLPNVTWLKGMIASPAFTGTIKAHFLLLSFLKINSLFESDSLFIALLIPFFFAINMSLSAYYIKKKAGSGHFAGLGITGIVAAMLGVGCAACGSVLFSAIIGFGATVGFLGFLPFDGREFGYLGIALIGISIIVLARKIQGADVCGIKFKSA